MQVVIKIPKEMYDWIYDANKFYEDYGVGDFIDIIKNGIPLPKGHGRLIDADKFLKDNEAYTGWILNSNDWGGENAYKDALEDLVNEADTIIEADVPKRGIGAPLEENDSGYNCENWIP